MLAYKVVNGPDKVTKRTAFRPATSLALQRIKYKIGETTRPEDSGPLAVFTRLRDALRWFREYGTHLLLVEIDVSDEQSLWKRNPPTFERNRWGNGYHAVSAGITERSIEECPSGTVLADRVTVLEDITQHVAA